MSKITVTEIAGQTSGSDQNLVKLPSNNTLQVDNIVNRGGDNDSGIDLGTNDVIRFKTANAESIRLDAGGSVLLGQTTPTDLHNTWNHLIMGNRGSIISQNGGGGIDGMTVSYNAYIDSDTGSYSYIATDEASILTQQNGILQYRNAGSGTAGNTVTFDTKLQIDADGSVTKPKQPFVRLRLTSHVNSSASTVSAPGNQVTGFQVNENVGNYWNSSNNNFTCPVTGVYQVSVFFIKYPSSGACHVDLHKNGSIVDEIRWRAPEAGNYYYQAGGTASVTCAANDVLDWHYFGTAGIHNSNGAWEIKLSH